MTKPNTPDHTGRIGNAKGGSPSKDTKSLPIVELEGLYIDGKPVIRPYVPEVNLNDWEWLREISGLHTEAVEHYKELARKNEVLMVAIQGKDAFNIYKRVTT